MLRRAKGVTIDEIAEALEWQPHTVRGAIAGALKKKLGLDVASEKDDKGGRVLPHHRLTSSGRIKPAERLGRFQIAELRPTSCVRSLIMLAAVIFEILGVRSGKIFVAALVASAIAVHPAVAGPKRLAHVPVSEVTGPPTGWVEFCARQPDRACDA